jgi:hypothetical protein
MRDYFRNRQVLGSIRQLDVVKLNFDITEIFTGGTYNTEIFALTGSYRIDTQSVFEGTHSWRSGAIGHSTTSDSYLKFQGAATDVLKFYYRVSSESRWDKLTIRVNGVVIVDAISGETEWAQIGPINLVNGENTIHMQYGKDGSYSSGTDSGYIDKIQIFR